MALSKRAVRWAVGGNYGTILTVTSFSPVATLQKMDVFNHLKPISKGTTKFNTQQYCAFCPYSLGLLIYYV